MDPRAPTPLDTAINLLGGQVALAALCEVTPQAVNQWVKKGKAPPKYVLRIESASGVSRYELDPEVFGQAPEAPRQ